MKILIVNKFFYPRGGDCVVAMSTREILLQNGHEVRVFAMQYPDNIYLPECAAYASRVNFNGGLKDKIKGARRIFGFDNIRKNFRRVLDDFKPDAVHFHNIHSYLSPALVEEAHRRGIRTVWTMHDYKLFCPAYSCRRPDGKICDGCITRPMVARYLCMKGSIAQSLLALAETIFWNRDRLQKSTDLFVAPSKFMASELRKAGIASDKIVEICNFVDPQKASVLGSLTKSERKGFCYIGRLSAEKGVATMIEAAVKAGVTLNVAGDGPLLEKLQSEYSQNRNIIFLGHLDAESVAKLLKKSKASVIPSEWYENNPLGVIESLAAGTPVIGSDIGGIPELINHSDGVVFKSGSVDELCNAFTDIESGYITFDNISISKRAAERFSAGRYLSQILSAYKS